MDTPQIMLFIFYPQKSFIKMNFVWNDSGFKKSLFDIFWIKFLLNAEFSDTMAMDFAHNAGWFKWCSITI